MVSAIIWQVKIELVCQFGQRAIVDSLCRNIGVAPGAPTHNRNRQRNLEQSFSSEAHLIFRYLGHVNHNYKILLILNTQKVCKSCIRNLKGGKEKGVDLKLKNWGVLISNYSKSWRHKRGLMRNNPIKRLTHILRVIDTLHV